MKTMPALLASAAFAFAGSAVSAQTQTLYVAGPGGTGESGLKSEVFDAFTERTGIEIVYTAGNSAANLAKLLAQKDNQQIDVVILNEGPMYQAIQLGLCRDDFDVSGHEENLYDFAKFDPPLAAGFGIVGLGVAYATEVFEENGWDAPTSWTDLEDPKFKGKMVFQPLNNGNGLMAMIQFADIYGGSVTNMDPAFEVMAERLEPNVLSFEPSSARLAEMFQSGEVVISVWSSTQVKVLAESGFPIELVYPEEGAPFHLNAACAVVTEEMKPEAIELINILISPEANEALGRTLGYGPVNKLAVLTEEESQDVPYGPGDTDKLLASAVDWSVVNVEREEWAKRWVREIER